MLNCMFRIDGDEELSFTRAVYYNCNPVPVKKPWRDATGGFGNFVPLQGWIRIYDTDGNCGEAFCSRGMVDNILPLILTGETRTYQGWYQYLYWKLRNFGFQSGQICDLGTFDLIMLDLMARRRHLPLHRFLGATKDWAAAYKGGGSLLSDDDDLVSDMTRYVDEGYTTIKFKVGSDWGHDMERDLRRLRKVRRAVGDEIEIAIDANQVFQVDDAITFAHMAEPYHPAWFEEPVHSHDMNSIKQVCDHTDLVVGFGESMRNSFAFETYAEKGVTHLMPLIGRVTSMSDLIRIRNLARSKHLRFSSGGTVWLNAAMGALYEENEKLENHEPMMLPMEECLSIHPTEEGGKLILPDLEGIPARLDTDKIARLGILESVRYIRPEDVRDFAVRASY